MVVVLPWHNPARLAGALCQLDNLSDGRIVLGLGRGLGRVEFEGLGVPMEESRGRFVEGAELILEGLEQGYVKYDGQFYQQPKRWLRPAPVRTFRGRTYASAVSPESLDIMARLGLGLLLIPQKPWPTVIEDVAKYREAFREVNGVEAPEPIMISQVFCDEDAERASELGYRHVMNYYGTVMRHYELAGEHFSKTTGYEYYSKTAKHLQSQSNEASEQWYADLQVFGTPKDCVEQIQVIKERIGCKEFVAMLSFGGMTQEAATGNVGLFAEKVMPELRKM
jgi:alkanesulfonate monooxygenase SsuD/methylene tetrahydromethanopterin reductase-like flavin-dependent oxidoreductase (luciferase family)